MTARLRLSPGQRVLVTALGLLIVAVQVMIVFAYRNLGSTTSSFGTATDVVTGLARVQRGIGQLQLDVERLRSPDDVTALAIQRGLLEQQIEVTLTATPAGGEERAGLERVRHSRMGEDVVVVVLTTAGVQARQHAQPHLPRSRTAPILAVA